MLNNFALPRSWDVDSDEDDSHGTFLGLLDKNDRGLMSTIRTIAEMSEKERGLILVIVQAIAAWNGLKEA